MSSRYISSMSEALGKMETYRPPDRPRGRSNMFVDDDRLIAVDSSLLSPTDPLHFATLAIALWIIFRVFG